MELKRVLSILWKWLWLIALAALASLMVSYWASSRMPKVYSTTTTLMVGQLVSSPNPQMQDFDTSYRLAQSYVQLIRRQPILQATVTALGLETEWESLGRRVSAASVSGTQLIEISVADTDPEQAKVIADEIGRQVILQSPTTTAGDQEQHRDFVRQQLLDLRTQIAVAEGQVRDLDKQLTTETNVQGVQDIQGRLTVLQQRITTWRTNYAQLLSFYQGSNTNYLSVVEPASVPSTPISPNIPLNVLLAVMVGVSLAIGGAFLVEYLDNVVKTEEDVEHLVHLPTLGTIRRIDTVRQPSDHLVTLRLPHSPATEAYRILRTNIQFASLNDPLPQLLITSPGPNEGKTMTACNLAISLAKAGNRVVLVDTDLRRPSIHRFFGVPNRQGLTNLLLDSSLAAETMLIEIPVPGLVSTEAGLWVMPSGPLPPNPAELLGAEAMRKRLAELKPLADVTLFDSPPVLAVADATILAGLCTSVILVADARRTRSEMLVRSKAMLDQVGARVVGVVLNKLTSGRIMDYTYYGYDPQRSGPAIATFVGSGAVNGHSSALLSGQGSEYPTGGGPGTH